MKYIVHMKSGAFTSFEVEAESPAEAEDKVFDDDDFPYLCAQCSGWGRDTYLELADEWEVVEIEEVKR